MCASICLCCALTYLVVACRPHRSAGLTATSPCHLIFSPLRLWVHRFLSTAALQKQPLLGSRLLPAPCRQVEIFSAMCVLCKVLRQSSLAPGWNQHFAGALVTWQPADCSFSVCASLCFQVQTWTCILVRHQCSLAPCHAPSSSALMCNTSHSSIKPIHNYKCAMLLAYLQWHTQ